MKSNYSSLKDLPEYQSGKIMEKFSYQVGDIVYNNLYDLLSNLDLLILTKLELQEQSDVMTKNMNTEKNENIKNQYKKNLSIIERSLFKINNNLNLFKSELSLINKNELIDLIDKLSRNRNPNKKTIRILNILEKGI